MNKPELPKLDDYLKFLDQLKSDNQIVANSMIPFLMRAFLELTIEQAWQVLSYWKERNDKIHT